MPSARLAGIVAELQQAALTSHVFEYPAKEWAIDRAALMLASYVEKEVLHAEAGRSVSIVGVGTGILVARCYLSHYEILPARRCVLVASPRHPMDKYRKVSPGWLGRWRFGAIASQMQKLADDVTGMCGKPPVPYGVIVTGTSLDAGMDKCDSQKVAGSLYTPPALLKGARAVIYDATPMPRAVDAKRVQEYVSAFLQHGWFVQA